MIILYFKSVFFIKKNIMNYSTRSTQLLQFKNSVYKYQKQSKGFLHQSKKATLIFFLSIPICQNQTIYIICSTKVEMLIKSSWNKMLLCLRHKHHVIANQIKWGFFLLMLYIYIYTYYCKTNFYLLMCQPNRAPPIFLFSKQ
jgi:hypothetical protein